jgi:uncharacterized membrane protein YqgA involved in biofilm formation
MAVIAGSIVGILLHRKLSVRYSEIVMKAIGLFTVVIGLDLAFKSSRLLLILVSLVLGGLLGELLRLDERLEALGKKLKERYSRDVGAPFVQGFIASSLLFCIGPMAIVGSLESGLKADHTLLFTKSLMDGIASIALASAMGFGVIFSAGAVLIYQGLLTIAAVAFKGMLPTAYIDLMSATGGILLLGVAANLTLNTKIKVASLLPAVFIAPLIMKILSLITG